MGRPARPHRKFSAVQNDAIGKRILVIGFFFFALGGFDSLMMRLQFARAERLTQP